MYVYNEIQNHEVVKPVSSIKSIVKTKMIIQILNQLKKHNYGAFQSTPFFIH